jgi:hypothetical protein
MIVAALTFGRLAHAESQQDLLVFASLGGLDRFSASDPAIEETDGHATASFLYTYSSDRFRFLGEYILSDTESELERLKAAWQIDEQTMLWFGRFHSISNFWTTEYHHGQFMQTSISRPGLEEWEDESGPLPSHISGVWLEHQYSVEERSVIDFGLVAGLAPVFANGQLVPFDFLDPESGHSPHISGRLVYRPDVLSTNQIGVVVAHNDISVDSNSNPTLAGLNSIQQLTVGAFSHWQWEEWSLISNLVYFDVDLRYGDADVNDTFIMGYVQLEHTATNDLTIFGRAEFSDGEDQSRYLQMLPAAVAHRQMLGVRWDFADSHALTMEIADTSAQGIDLSHDYFKEFRIQWSAVFP